MNSAATRTFLLVLGVAFLPYGIYCFLVPGYLLGAAGVSASTPTGVTELRAMYGGLQAAFGVLMLSSARDPRIAIAGLAAAACVMPGLGLARLAGVVMDGSVSAYTIGALVFELGSSAVAISLLRKRIPPVQ